MTLLRRAMTRRAIPRHARGIVSGRARRAVELRRGAGELGGAATQSRDAFLVEVEEIAGLADAVWRRADRGRCIAERGRSAHEGNVDVARLAHRVRCLAHPRGIAEQPRETPRASARPPLPGARHAAIARAGLIGRADDAGATDRYVEVRATTRAAGRTRPALTRRKAGVDRRAVHRVVTGAALRDRSGRVGPAAQAAAAAPAQQRRQPDPQR